MNLKNVFTPGVGLKMGALVAQGVEIVQLTPKKEVTLPWAALHNGAHQNQRRGVNYFGNFPYIRSLMRNR